MPAPITHAYFGLDIYSKLDSRYQAIIGNHLEDLKTFSVASDIFYFYFGITKQSKTVKSIHKLIHQTNTKDYLINLVKYIKTNNLQYNGEVLSFLYGALSHYFLDSMTHPYIIYRSGVFKPKDRQTHKYNNFHDDIESYIDAYMIYHRENILPKDFKVHKFLFNNTLSPDVLKMIDEVFKETYDVENISSVYNKAMKKMKANLLKRYDPWGIKLALFKISDLVAPRCFLKQSPYSYHIKLKKKKHYLNSKKETWNNPVDEFDKSNLSFIELYVIALDKCMKALEQINGYLFDNKNIRSVENVILNISYLTGKDLEEEKEIKYFEF